MEQLLTTKENVEFMFGRHALSQSDTANKFNNRHSDYRSTDQQKFTFNEFFPCGHL
jgi:hypothetical protein